ncbi:fibroblast growth factor 19-like [Acipenser ruthenus]|uniref:fibroblast growth factor 19-like n=1 Tax=Acipenser ruthenus TaxID=7906 RepID=UPI002740A7BB|nr:fibroblast growth factor 19-like [Acipenser ruthenus]
MCEIGRTAPRFKGGAALRLFGSVTVLCLTTLPGSGASPLRRRGDSSPLLLHGDQVRLRHLYTANERTSLHLEIDAEGSVRGSTEQNVYTLLEIKSVQPGVTVIRGLNSAHYLCMDHRGRLHGARSYSEPDCSFQELLLPDGYSVFLSAQHSAVVSLGPARHRHHSPGKRLPPLSQFLPVLSLLPPQPQPAEFEALALQGLIAHRLDLDSEDPFGASWGGGQVNPSFINKK